MDTKNSIQKAVRQQMKLWASMGGVARGKKLSASRRKTIARNAGIASGKAKALAKAKRK